MLSEKIEQYISEKVENLKDEPKKEVEEMVTNEANKTKTIWDFNTNDRDSYYYIDEAGYLRPDWFDEGYFEIRRDLGNAFLTEEEAEFELERRKIEAILRKYSRPFKYDEYNYHIEYYHDDNTLCIGVYRCVSVGTPCFETKKIARKVIDEIGKDRLKKYWFGVAK